MYNMPSPMDIVDGGFCKVTNVVTLRRAPVPSDILPQDGRY